jgi:hypothetical protein
LVDRNFGLLGTFEAASGAGVLPAKEAAFFTSPDCDISTGRTWELDCLLAGSYLLSTRDAGRHTSQLTNMPTQALFKG